jgi:hypothetical protein
MKVPLVLTFSVLLCALTLFASPTDQEKVSQVSANTKLQVFFSELETQWLKAEQDKDSAALNRIISDDFRIWTPASGKPISRSDWLLGVFGQKLLSFHVQHLATRELTPQSIVVSFVRTETYQQSATPESANRFIVDIWINSGAGDNWRCTDRYSSEVRGVPRQH